MPAPSALFVQHVPSPIGLIQLSGTEKHLFSAKFVENSPEKDSLMIPDCLHVAATQLTEYFNGQRHSFDLPLHAQGTFFQQQVWQALQEIPVGRTDHYLGLAKRLGNAGAVRAVGVANGANPWLVLVPCHRVIGAQGQLVGYAGGLWRKKWLLEHEAKMSGTYQTSLF
ncbi:methylated-DNA--[protein]-cysteine S-methyltransferase [Rufibacter glacialis]|uniref:Methylated-DNA--protein-cysteine methyltransferase n=1 Tax=Rufibacter glacialis TaxID=1259555 RepID=A0A5M8QDX6_9BACT|nr:methylated-DNA--[protein]-cysteine S-methyltransferase [Rufibacter glacialis]KAA6433291.1 methylated-DNA--[protein]-cysteine S-methyltransferase [Rufibacter glacialis]GGK75732.1 methylated-DNA--protein-cysteine methyltransferase [Rufibacter glacialis]